MNRIELNRCFPLWMGQIEGHMQVVSNLSVRSDFTAEEISFIISSLLMIQSSANAIIKLAKDAREAV